MTPRRCAEFQLSVTIQYEWAQGWYGLARAADVKVNVIHPCTSTHIKKVSRGGQFTLRISRKAGAYLRNHPSTQLRRGLWSTRLPKYTRTSSSRTSTASLSAGYNGELLASCPLALLVHMAEAIDTGFITFWSIRKRWTRSPSRMRIPRRDLLSCPT